MQVVKKTICLPDLSRCGNLRNNQIIDKKMPVVYILSSNKNGSVIMKKWYFIILLLICKFQQTIAQNYSYNQNGSEYSVTFNKKPLISNSLADGISFERAEIENKLSYLRAESIVYKDASLIETIDKDYIYSVFEDYANAEGLSNSGYTFSVNSLGKAAQMVAYKTYRKDNQLQTTKFVVRAYYGSYSAIFLYTMCPSKVFPTSEVSIFLNSIKRH